MKNNVYFFYFTFQKIYFWWLEIVLEYTPNSAASSQTLVYGLVLTCVFNIVNDKMLATTFYILKIRITTVELRMALVGIEPGTCEQ